MCLFCPKLHVFYLLSLTLCYKWKIDDVTIHVLPQKIEWDAYTSIRIPSASASASLSALMLACAQYNLNGLLDFDQNLPVYNTWTCQNPYKDFVTLT